jgi:hypothetical protein
MRDGRPGCEPTRQERLAMSGLATLLSWPALMHGLKGHLHNLTLVTELLQKECAGQADAATLRAVAEKRTKSLRAEIAAMHRQVRLVEAIANVDQAPEEGVCDVRASLHTLLPTARVEAARRRVSLHIELEPAVERVECAPLAFEQLMLACWTQAIRHCSHDAAIVVSAKCEGTGTRIDFACDNPFEGEDHAADRELLGMLARVAGATFTAQPAMSLTFRSAC